MATLDALLPELAPYAKWLVSQFPGLKVTSVYRSPTDQLRLWNARSSNPYPVARPGTSYHEYRRAWDMVGPPELLERAGRVWESMGGTWGGRPRIAGHRPDPIHFQA